MKNKHLEKTIEQIDFNLLHKQLQYLVDVYDAEIRPENDIMETNEEQESLQGLINLIENILDAAEQDGLFSFPVIADTGAKEIE